MLVPNSALLALLTRRRLRADAPAGRGRVVAECYGVPYRPTRWLPFRPHPTDVVALWLNGADRTGPPTHSVEVHQASTMSAPGRCE